MLKKQFDGGLDKPIQYCVTVVAWPTDTGHAGKAFWPFSHGRCRVDLKLENGQFLVNNFETLDTPAYMAAIKERGLQPDEIAYLEQCFRATIAEPEETT